MANTALLLFTDPDTGRLLRRKWRIDVIDGRDAGSSVEITRTPALIGATPAATLILTDDTVSRYHAELHTFADGVRVRDLDSTNGTYIGEKRVKEAFVEPGGIVRLGRTSIRADAIDDNAEPDVTTDPHGVPPGAIERMGAAIAVAPSTRELFRAIRRVAPSLSPVLLEGGPGTGRATIARLIHDMSPRAPQPFFAFSPLEDYETSDPPDTDELIRRRLFGMGGSGPIFKGASAEGLFELANGGTLFLEEIGQIPVHLQQRIRRTLEHGEVQREGEERKRRIDVRLISSTSQSLRQAKDFDPALHRRIAVVRLAVPSLEQREEDLIPLAEHFLMEKTGQSVHLSEQFRAAIRRERWTSLDDLKGAVLALVTAPWGSSAARAETAGAAEPAGAAARLRFAFVTDLLLHHDGDITLVAKALAIPQGALFRFLSENDISLDDL